MTRRMLIDAAHEEETRVVVMDGNRVVDYDAEIANKRPLKGNIYLAKVTRVEPSLQAAFIEYGGNRHGFLAFNEIHPDYYRIPIADREALIAEEAAAQLGDDGEEGESVETVGGDELEEVERRRVSMQRRYKIQEVIKRRQILLIQVVKEERGTKGAALTTYLSLPGRYCVLMPNTSRGGGISRKITNVRDRKRLKTVIDGLGIADGMAIILRTAGSERSKAEIKRDYDYLLRLWNNIRESTLASTAPTLIYEEGNLIKRTIRDLYAKEIEEILVEGEDGYKTAKDFMKTLIPSHAKKVKKYASESVSLFQEFRAESLLGSIHNPTVQLRSGGYIVLHQTEALVAIDVNSGRATRERHIEETALKTNCEAAEEIAYQLKLRDLAGLIVIDFIDMEENRNNITVERRFKDSLRSDRARIQIGRISPFGLLEMSRQRLRPSLIEITGDPCPHCGGTGFMQSTDWTALQVLRAMEETANRERATSVELTVSAEVALYILNQKRQALSEIEERNGLSVKVSTNGEIRGGIWEIEVLQRAESASNKRSKENGDEERSEEGGRRRRRGRRRKSRQEDNEANAAEVAEATDIAEDREDEDNEERREDGERTRRRRRRGRRSGRRRNRNADEQVEAAEASTREDSAAEREAASKEALESQAVDTETDDSGAVPAATEVEAVGEGASDGSDESKSEEKPKRRRRRRTKKEIAEAEAKAVATAEAPPSAEAVSDSNSSTTAAWATSDDPTPDLTVDAAEAVPEQNAVSEPTEEALAMVASDYNYTERKELSETTEAARVAETETSDEPAEPPRRGWWQRVVN